MAERDHPVVDRIRAQQRGVAHRGQGRGLDVAEAELVQRPDHAARGEAGLALVQGDVEDAVEPAPPRIELLPDRQVARRESDWNHEAPRQIECRKVTRRVGKRHPQPSAANAGAARPDIFTTSMAGDSRSPEAPPRRERGPEADHQRRQTWTRRVCQRPRESRNRRVSHQQRRRCQLACSTPPSAVMPGAEAAGAAVAAGAARAARPSPEARMIARTHIVMSFPA